MPAQWAWHFGILLSLRERLLRDRGALRSAAAQPLETHGVDQADSATDELNLDLALSALSAEEDALYEVDEALQRILNGSYGRCEETGQPIPAERLRAIPWTRFCRAVEERLESERNVWRAQLGQVRSIHGTVATDMESIEPEDQRLRSIRTPARERTRVKRK